MTLVTPARRAQLAAIGRIGGLTFSATNDTAALSSAGRTAFRASFQNGHECAACPPVTIATDISEDERDRRADALYRLHFARLAQRRA